MEDKSLTFKAAKSLSCPSSSPGQHQFSNYPTPNQDQNFVSSQQPPPLSGGTQHHSGLLSHYNTNYGNATYLPTRSDNSTSLLGKNLLSSYSPPTLAKRETPLFVQEVPSPAAQPTSVITRDSPYFTQPPLPPLQNPAVSPNDEPRKDSTSAIVYQNSPYFSEAPNLDTVTGSSESSSSSAGVANRPVPAKSAFMCFSEANGQAISDRIGTDEGKDRYVEVVAAEWRGLTKQDKAYWEDMAKNEKTRFANEKKAYKGPITRKLRAKKNPLAPKRPMSAFLMYAQQKRRPLQRENPDMPNADISRLLGELWRNTSLADKRPFLEREEFERKIYKAKVEAWKNNEKLATSLTPLKSPTAAATRVSGARKKETTGPRLECSTSFTREESHDQKYELVKSTKVSRPRNKKRSVSSNEAPIVNCLPKGSNTVDQDAIGEKRQAAYYEFNTNNWSPSHNYQTSGCRRKYTYPRPP